MTPFSEIYSFFLAQLDTYEYINLTDEERNTSWSQTLRLAVARCRKCKPLRNIEIDYDLEELRGDLDDQAILIISMWMIITWVTPKINNITLLEQSLSSKDYQTYSQANHLKELMDLKANAMKEVNYEMQKYSFDKRTEEIENGLH